MTREYNTDEAAPIPENDPSHPQRGNATLAMFLSGFIAVAFVLSYAVFSAGLSPSSVAIPAMPTSVIPADLVDMTSVRPDSAPDRGRTDEIPTETTTPVTPDGSTPDGSTPDGSTPDGSTPDGSAPENPAGVMADGSTPISLAARVSDYPPVSSTYSAASLPQHVRKVGRGYSFGKKNTGKNIIMWVDLQCPSCAILHRDIAEPMKETVARKTANVQYFVTSSLGPGSRIAANALGCAADQGRFYEFLDQAYVYQLQGNTTGNQLTHKDMLQWGKELNMENEPEYISCVKQGTYFDYVDGIQELSENVGIVGTPTMYADQKDVIATLTTFPAFLATIGLPEDAFPIPGQ